jgi:two-component system invasion response regulator UvrY
MVNVLLVDDHELVRTGIEHLLRESNGIDVVGVACSGEEAIDQVAKLQPDVVLMDINMPGIGGIEASKKISRRFPDVKIIALTVHADGPFPQRLLSAGAHGYISKSSPVSELVSAIWSVYNGRRYLSADVASELAFANIHGINDSPFNQLSQRELQVVTMTLQGKSIQEMSKLLAISVKTISTYRYRVFDKLSVKNDVELTRLATKYRLIDDAASGS